jgi:Leucine Rich Repeat
LPELGTLTVLETLNLRGCSGLTDLPELSTMTALQTLDLRKCSPSIIISQEVLDLESQRGAALEVLR